MISRDERVRWARWVGTFVGFPLAGVTARAVVGPIGSVGDALGGGLAGGVVLGLVQSAIGGLERRTWVRWTALTAVGLAGGLAAGARTVDFGTAVADLVAMGAITGLGVGAAQSLGLPMRASDRLLWAVATPALWALGWLITSQVIVDAERQHAVFGSSGALVVSVLAGALHVIRRRHQATDRAVSIVGAGARTAVAR